MMGPYPGFLEAEPPLAGLKDPVDLGDHAVALPVYNTIGAELPAAAVPVTLVTIAIPTPEENEHCLNVAHARSLGIDEVEIVEQVAVLKYRPKTRRRQRYVARRGLTKTTRTERLSMFEGAKGAEDVLPEYA